MTMTKKVATMRITDELREAEVAIDEALLRQSALLTELVRARMATEERNWVGQAEIMRLIKAQQAVTSSANDLARVHGGLLKIGQEKGLIEDCPEKGPIKGLSEAA
ncbi:hypothetical protein [Alteraurantiacibacter aquimixticola]|uniref:Uncharacterized protein n=1 Tax=Alteraurantiacibacter aquimixticola TaxID=2489173 RepID=A0A4T3F2W6_9SPHN|nr:hypothetical protein [Alteraurantiacibacter aquimixticola]TIX50450.1 hypothetical protein E5222_09250 [Alteraurantiacibacter aquimixticola]